MKKNFNEHDLKKMEQYKNETRRIDVTYIYGDNAGSQIDHLINLFGKDIYVVDYDSMFDDYAGEGRIIFKRMSLDTIAYYLDGSPCKLDTCNGKIWACYSEVFIVTDLPLIERCTMDFRLYVDYEKNLLKTLLSHISKVGVYNDWDGYEYSLEEHFKEYGDVLQLLEEGE